MSTCSTPRWITFSLCFLGSWFQMDCDNKDVETLAPLISLYGDFKDSVHSNHLHTHFNTYRCNVESNSTTISVAQVQCRAQIDTLLCSALSYPVAAFERWRLETFWRSNLDQTVGIHKDNLDCKLLISFRATRSTCSDRLSLPDINFFLCVWRRAPQQKLRTHRSLKAYLQPL